MKITKSQLKRIIKEELTEVLNEYPEPPPEKPAELDGPLPPEIRSAVRELEDAIASVEMPPDFPRPHNVQIHVEGQSLRAWLKSKGFEREQL